MSEHAEIISVLPPTGEGRWRPIRGPEALSLLERKLPTSQHDRVLDESARILAQCLPPSSREGGRTGLVMGYVQSGKTMSFTTVAALARDNGYPLVIVLAGTTNNLVDQNETRLKDDLIGDAESSRWWRVMVNPRPTDGDADLLRQALDSWKRYPDRPERCRTTLIVVMKQHQHLNNLRELLRRVEPRDACAIVIDDEGDQASLNAKVRHDAESTTYMRIRMLREVLPIHTYLLYTATPQAPLLISRIDTLSPEFAELIETGDGYVGGVDLFTDGSPYVSIIPEADLPHGVDELTEPPESFLRALRLFFLGVAAGHHGGAREPSNRSMMIHPSSSRDLQRDFAGWARAVKTSWTSILREPAGSPDRRELIADLEDAYRDLQRTAVDLPSFDILLEDLEYAIDETQVREVNSRVGKIEPVPWRENYSYILVGGQGLDRGFTVEGLTVTYMPRGPGTGTADTIQQRARFFGYKAGYLGLVRVFLEADVCRAFQAYVEHESSVRDSLRRHRDAGLPLKDWPRAFFLDRALKPTRRTVVSLDWMRPVRSEWAVASNPLVDEDAAAHNRAVASAFVDGVRPILREDEGSDARTPEQRHLKALLPLDQVMSTLLEPLRHAHPEDSLRMFQALWEMSRALDEEDASLDCAVYIMSGGEPRERTVAEGGIEQLFQGSNARTGYPGDRKIADDSLFTVQLHQVVRKGDGAAAATPVVAIRTPARMQRDVVYQPPN
jgi:hypothetical protein